MNILIENSETLEYLTGSGKWSKDPLAGRCFRASEAAFETAKLEAIGKFNIVGHIPTTNQFVNLDHGRGKGLPEAGGASPPTGGELPQPPGDAGLVEVVG